MGAALYVVFEREISGYAPGTAMDGKALARFAYDEDDSLNDECKAAGLFSIIDFYYETIIEAYEKIGEIPPEDLNHTEETNWFSPMDGLCTVDFIIKNINKTDSNKYFIDDLL